MNFRNSTVLGRTGLHVSRLGIGSSYGVPSYSIEKAFHEYGINYFFWSLPRRKGMKSAVQHLVQTEREEMDEALRTPDSPTLSAEEMERIKRIGDFIHG